METVRNNRRLAELQVKWLGEAFKGLPLQSITDVVTIHQLVGLKWGSGISFHEER